MEGILNELNLNYMKSLRGGLDPLLQEMQDKAREAAVPIVSY